MDDKRNETASRETRETPKFRYEFHSPSYIGRESSLRFFFDGQFVEIRGDVVDDLINGFSGLLFRAGVAFLLFAFVVVLFGGVFLLFALLVVGLGRGLRLTGGGFKGSFEGIGVFFGPESGGERLMNGFLVRRVGCWRKRGKLN